jgi:divalent metal cation (Fe/Co/Zn/Cd) transporter
MADTADPWFVKRRRDTLERMAVDLTVHDPPQLELARRARLLAWTSLAWLGFEGAATAIAGVLAGSIALVGNGLDSGIEALASIVVVWRFAAARVSSDRAERTAQRIVAVSFFLLAPYLVFEAIRTLAVEHHAETTWLGIGVSMGTLCVCPWLGRAKLRLGERLGSAATAGEGRQNLICAYLALGVLAGLLANTLFGIWWLDPGVALAIAGVAVREGRASLRGEVCGCSDCAVPLTH